VTGLNHAIDEVEELAVGSVFDPTRRVVLEHHPARRDLGMKLQVRVAVEVRQDDAVRTHALTDQ